MGLRAKSGAAQSSPLYPHARETLEALDADPGIVMGVATGKSRRGLDKLMEAHGLGRFFATTQVSDNHPSKPHPSMVRAALAQTGVAADDAVMIGDTRFDIEMAHAAGIAAIGVSWGYHQRKDLRGAKDIIDDFTDLPASLMRIWEAVT